MMNLRHLMRQVEHDLCKKMKKKIEEKNPRRKAARSGRGGELEPEEIQVSCVMCRMDCVSVFV